MITKTSNLVKHLKENILLIFNLKHHQNSSLEMLDSKQQQPTCQGQATTKSASSRERVYGYQ